MLTEAYSDDWWFDFSAAAGWLVPPWWTCLLDLSSRWCLHGPRLLCSVAVCLAAWQRLSDGLVVMAGCCGFC
jgi:hypothetical protein